MATPGAVQTAGLRIQVAPLRSSRLLRDYLDGVPALAPFYTGHPRDPVAYRRKAAEVATRLTPDARRAAGACIRATSDAAADRLDRVLAGDGVFVTTGQQAGLFGGPLYTAHKILTAVKLARSLEDVLDTTVAPLFWVAADDHDWAEVDHTFALTPQNELRRITVPEDPAAPPHPMSRRLLDDRIAESVAEFAALLPATEFSPALQALVASAYQPGRSMAEAFEELLAGIFAAHDVLLVNPSDARLKRLAAPVMRRELERAEVHARLLARQSDRLVTAGYHAQVNISEDAANVLMHDEQGRDRLVREDGAWLLRRTRRRLNEAELFATLEADPGAFSANVLLRPVLESSLFPTVAYVGGPAEVSYFGQIGCLFDAHGVMAPLVFPRLGVTLIESKVKKVLDKFSMTPADFARPFHEVTAQLVREETPAEVSASLTALRDTLAAGYERLSAAAEQVDPTLRGWLEGQRNNALAQTDAAARKVASHLKKKNEIELEQLRKAALNLHPEGSPQERVLNLLPYLARYGPTLLDDLLAAMGPKIDAPAPAWTGAEC